MAAKKRPVVGLLAGALAALSLAFAPAASAERGVVGLFDLGELGSPITL